MRKSLHIHNLESAALIIKFFFCQTVDSQTTKKINEFVMKLTLFVIFILIITSVTGTLQYAGQFNVIIVNENGEVQHVQVEGVDLFTAHPKGMPLLAKLPYPSEDDYAGQNYVTIDKHHIQLFPAGNLGLNHLYLFDLVSKTWDTIIVYSYC